MMSLKQWAENGWLRPHKTSAQEISNLFEIVERDLRDAEGNVSPDWQFGIAYNATLKLCTILLYASGYRPEKNMAHYRTLQALPEILGDKFKKDTDYLDACRIKRNSVEYDFVGGATAADAKELIQYALELRENILNWLKKSHPNLLPKKK
ncbi:MAG: hypothetical protein SGI74_07620 [Oligoflexia bacterium]|nr:hypothetical protein [Oligoflexia bacterium]